MASPHLSLLGLEPCVSPLDELSRVQRRAVFVGLWSAVNGKRKSTGPR